MQYVSLISLTWGMDAPVHSHSLIKLGRSQIKMSVGVLDMGCSLNFWVFLCTLGYFNVNGGILGLEPRNPLNSPMTKTISIFSNNTHLKPTHSNPKPAWMSPDRFFACLTMPLLSWRYVWGRWHAPENPRDKGGNWEQSHLQVSRNITTSQLNDSKVR